jgi:hypothetical protein
MNNISKYEIRSNIIINKNSLVLFIIDNLQFTYLAEAGVANFQIASNHNK